MNRHQKKALSLAAAIANLSFSIAVAGVATYAWFYENRSVSASSLNVGCAIPNSKLVWKVLKYNDDKKEGIPYTSSSTPNSGTKMFYLDPFDNYIEKKNEYSNVLLRAEINYESGSYYTSAKQIYIDISCVNNAYLENDNEGTKNYTSNISQFKVTVASYVDSNNIVYNANAAIHDEINEDGIAYTSDDEYKTATNYFNTDGVYGTPFVTVHNDTPSKDRDNKIVTIPKFNCGNKNVKKIVVYLECSYSKDLVKYYLSKHNVAAGTEVEFFGDISQIYFRDGTAYNGAYVRVSGTSSENAEDEISQSDLNKDYMIVYPDWGVAFDGSFGKGIADSDELNTQSELLKGNKNYIPVNVHGNRIDYNEVTADSSWKYTTGSRLKGEKFFVGRSSAGSSENGMNAGTSSNPNYNHTITYKNGYTELEATTGSSELRFDKAKGTTQFNYIPNANAENYQSLHLYKLDKSKTADVYPTALTISGTPKTEFYVGDEFELGDSAYITITYSDTTTKRVGTNECTFTGYDMNQNSRQKVTVTHTDGGYTVSNDYYIDVTFEPTIELDYEVLNIYTGSTKTITAYDYNFTQTPTFAWTVSSGDSSKVTFSSTSVRNPSITISTAGSYTIRCTGTYLTQTDYAECVVTVTQSASGTYTKVDSLTDGDEVLIVSYANSNYYYLPAATTSSSPAYGNGTKVTISNNKITGSLDAELFTVSSSSTNWIFQNSNNKYLYATSSNSGIRIGDTSDTWTLTSKSNGYAMKENNNNRYLGIYSSGSDWRSYTSSNHDNYGGSGEAINFFKKTSSGEMAGTLNKIMVSSPKTAYYTDDTFTSPTVTAYYTNGTSKDVSGDATFTGYDLTETGNQTVTVSYTDDGVTKTTTYSITVTQSTLSSISITTASSKTYFLVDSVFSAPDLQVTATYTSTNTRVLSSNEYTLSTPNMSSTGDKTITITYEEGGITKTAEYTIHVVAKELTSLVMTNAPSKVTYNAGEYFSAAGATFKAIFNGNNDQVKTEDTTITSHVSYDKTEALTTSDTTVTFSYSYGGVTETVQQSITVNNQSVLIKNGDDTIESLSMVASSRPTLSAVTSNFTNSPSIQWSVGNSNLVEIVSGETSSSVVLQFKQIATASANTTLTCTATSGGQVASKEITLTVTKLEVDISETSHTFSAVNDQYQLTFTKSEGATINWTTSNSSVATVSDSGKVTAKGSGTCTITATVGANGITATDSCSITVSATHSVSISGSSSVAVGHTINLTGSCAAGDTITWTSSDTTIATVDSSTGVVTGVAAGSATIKAQCAHGEYDTKVISVTEHTLTISGTDTEVEVNDHITLTASDNCGDTITWTFEAIDANESGEIGFTSSKLSTTTGTSVDIYGITTGTVRITASCAYGEADTYELDIISPSLTETLWGSIDFTTNKGTNVQNYTSVRTISNTYGSWNVVNGNNNNNGWDGRFKFGPKNNASGRGYICSPQCGSTGIAATKIVINVYALVNNTTNTIKIYGTNSLNTSNLDLTNELATLSSSSVGTGDNEISVNSQTSYKYYIIEFQCNNTTSTNGSITVKSVAIYYMA